jgi:protein-disulfide isomerase
MYVSVVAIFLVSATAAGSLAALPAGLGRDLGRVRRSSTGATLAVAWLVASIALVVFFPRDKVVSAAGDSSIAASAPLETLTPEQLTEWHKWLDAQPRAPEVAPSGPVKVLVVKFNDFECPACRQMWAEYRGVVAKWEASHPTDVQFQNRDFPLESECGFGGMHPYACEAAVAVRLAATKNRGQQMGDWFFEHQDSMDRNMIKDGLKQVAQITDFEEQYQKMLPAVRADAQLGQKLGVQGTPTFFINGIKLPSLRPAYFDAAIAHELQKAGATS